MWLQLRSRYFFVTWNQTWWFVLIFIIVLNVGFYLSVTQRSSEGTLFGFYRRTKLFEKRELNVTPVLWKGTGDKVYRVFYNVFPAEKRFPDPCCGSFTGITFTTHGTAEFLHHVTNVSSRWKGPVSVAVYAPGDDFRMAVETIEYLRSCESPDVRDWVSFHIFHEEDDITDSATVSVVNCSLPFILPESYRKQHSLTYPVNVARNIARIAAANTRYILAADVELYPSVGVIQKFAEFVKNRHSSSAESPRVFILPIFEVEKNASFPDTKKDLVSLVEQEKAVTFHRFFCLSCHQIPNEKAWLNYVPSDSEPLKVFGIAPQRVLWEPLYIGTHEDPLYDDRLQWEGMSDKITQIYEMCLRGYEFHILDAAFLVHAPGIKRRTVHTVEWRNQHVFNQMPLKYQIIREIHTRFKKTNSCFIS